MDAEMRYDPLLFITSIVVAVGFATLALYVQCRFRSAALRTRAGAAAIMGFAISAMHYTGMAGVSFFPVTHINASVSSSTELLATAATVITVVILSLAIIASMVEHMVSKIRDSQRHFESLVDMSTNMIFTVSENTIKFANRAALNALGVDRLEAIVGRSITDFVHENYTPIFESSGEGLADLSSRHEQMPIILVPATADDIDGELTVSRRDGEAKPTYVLEIQDITHRKHAAAAILKREQYMQGIMEHAADGIMTLDEDDQIETYNQAASQMFGFHGTEIADIKFPHIISGGIDLQPGTREVEAVRKDGSIFPVDLSVSVMPIFGGRRHIAIARDITMRKLAQAGAR